MPKGARDKPLKAILATYGFSHTLVKQMLNDLEIAGQIVWDMENEVWKLPTFEEGKEE